MAPAQEHGSHAISSILETDLTDEGDGPANTARSGAWPEKTAAPRATESERQPCALAITASHLPTNCEMAPDERLHVATLNCEL